MDRSGPRIERGRVGDRGPRVVLVYAELNRRVLRSVVLHVNAWRIEVPALAFDPVVPSPEGWDIEAVVHVHFARPQRHVEFPLDWRAVCSEILVVGLAVVVVGGPVPVYPVVRACRQVARVPHHLVDAGAKVARVVGPVAVHLDEQGDRGSVYAGAVLDPEAIGPVPNLEPVLAIPCLGVIHQHPRPDVDVAVGGVVDGQVPVDHFVARGWCP